MKIRTDFVTNSSSSNFIFKVILTDKNGKNYTLGGYPIDLPYDGYDFEYSHNDALWYSKSDEDNAKETFEKIKSALEKSERNVIYTTYRGKYIAHLDSIDSVTHIRNIAASREAVDELESIIDELLFDSSGVYKMYAAYPEKEGKEIAAKVVKKYNLDERSAKACEQILTGDFHLIGIKFIDTFYADTKTTKRKVLVSTTEG